MKLKRKVVEVWKTCVQNDRYEVSTLGRVRTRYKSNRFPPGKVLKTYIDPYGYPTVFLWKNSTPKHYRIHWLVSWAFLGPKPLKCECRHLDDNKLNSKLSNLKWGTRKENIQDAIINDKYNGLKTGRVVTEEVRIKLSKSLTERKLSDETKQKMSETHKIRWDKRKQQLKSS